MSSVLVNTGGSLGLTLNVIFPVVVSGTSGLLSNISKTKVAKKTNKPDKVYIDIGTFYSIKTAKFLKERIIKEIPELDKRLKIRKINNKKTQVILGPYTSVILLKNDYIKLQNFGFEDLNVFIN